METKIAKKIKWGLPAALAVPGALIGLFYLLRGSRAAMDVWVFRVLAPVEQFLGRLWSAVPFSGMELLIALFLAGNLLWLARCAVLAAGLAADMPPVAGPGRCVALAVVRRVLAVERGLLRLHLRPAQRPGGLPLFCGAAALRHRLLRPKRRPAGGPGGPGRGGTFCGEPGRLL